MSEYVIGEPHPNTLPYARFEYKRGSPDHSGGGYPRWRSKEYRPETARQGSQDVFVPVHRLCAVAWLLPDGELGTDVFLSDLEGYDVHHELGMPSANIESELSLRDHGKHSEITAAQQRAWAEDSRQQAFEFDEQDIPETRCVRCDDPTETAYYVDGEAHCLECSTVVADGKPIQVGQ